MALNGTVEIFGQKSNRPLRYLIPVTNSLIHATRHITVNEAAQLLRITRRQVFRLLNAYRTRSQ